MALVRWFPCAAVLFCAQVIAQTPAGPIGGVKIHGPMTGAVTLRSARIWAQLDGPARQEALNVWVEYRAKTPDQRVTGRTLRSAPVRAGQANHWNAEWLIDQLEPGTVYDYRIKWRGRNDQGASGVATFKTQTHWQFRSDPPALRFVAGSCAYTNDAVSDRPGRPYGRSTEIYQSMARREPDLTLWMGDNIYFREPDFGDETAMAQRYDQWRALPDLQALLRTGSHLATWDDHDYGANDSNGSNPQKDVSLKLFKRYWANPTYGLPGQPGVFTQHVASDAEFFILDDRWYRDSDKLQDDNQSMLGADQLRWLKNALLASSATWKFIISGSQVLNLNNQFEGWHHFEKESRGFLAWMEAQKIPGIIFLSGDRHFSTLLKLDRPDSYPIYELTCSPLTAGTYDNPVGDLSGNARIVPDTVVTKNNFCELEITGARKDRRLSIAIRDAQGELQWTRSIHESDLR